MKLFLISLVGLIFMSYSFFDCLNFYDFLDNQKSSTPLADDILCFVNPTRPVYPLRLCRRAARPGPGAFVRFGWRNDHTFTSRWTAPDPLGRRGRRSGLVWVLSGRSGERGGSYGIVLELDCQTRCSTRTQGRNQKGRGKGPLTKIPRTSFLKGLIDFLNGKGLDEDPKSMDADKDGISDYYDYDSDWNVNPEQLKKDREGVSIEGNKAIVPAIVCMADDKISLNRSE